MRNSFGPTPGMTPISASVMPDGRTIVVRFAGPLRAQFSTPDWATAEMYGAAARLGDSPLRCLGAYAEVDDYIALHEDDGSPGTGGSLAAGGYLTAYTIRDSAGRLLGSSDVSAFKVAKDGDIHELYGFDNCAVPIGCTADVYLGATDQPLSSLRLYFSGLPAGTQKFKFFVPPTSPAPLFPGRLTIRWTGVYSLPNDAPPIVKGEALPALSLPAGLLNDQYGAVSAGAVLPSVENRSWVGLDGFAAVFPTGPGAADIYVSSSRGDDRRSFTEACNPTTPWQTLNRVYSYIAAKSNGLHSAGIHVWHLISDVWDMAVAGNSGGINVQVQGASADYPVVLGGYWDTSFGPKPAGARWTIKGLDGVNCLIFNRNLAANDVPHWVVIDEAQFIGGPGATKATTAGSTYNISDIFVSDTVFRGVTLSFQALGHNGPSPTFKQQRVTFHRSAILDTTQNDGSHLQGLFTYGVTEALLADTVIDHCGWHAGFSASDIFSHGWYDQYTCGPVISCGCTFSNNASHGAQIRSGGVVADGLFLNNALANFINVQPGGSMCRVASSGARDITGSPRGFGPVVNAALGNTGAAGMAASIAMPTAGVIAQDVISVNANTVNKTPAAFEVDARTHVVYIAIVRNLTTGNAGRSVWPVGSPVEDYGSVDLQPTPAANLDGWLARLRNRPARVWDDTYSAAVAWEQMQTVFAPDTVEGHES